MFPYTSFPYLWRNAGIQEYLRNNWHYVSALCTYESSIRLGNPIIRTPPYMASQGNIWRSILAIYTCISSVPLGNTCICTFQTLHHRSSHIVITRPHMHIRYSGPLGNSNIHALQIYNVSINSFNVILQSYVHTWHSRPLGNSCITSSLDICHLMKSTQRHYSVTHAYMTF